MDMINEIIEKYNIFIEVVEINNLFYYKLKQLASKEDREILESGECEDSDMYLESHIINSDWEEISYNTYQEALTEGKKIAAKQFSDILKKEYENTNK
jgi:hypothetical protein